MILKKLLVFFIFLTFLYNINYTFLPVHSIVLMGLMGAVLLIYQLQKRQVKCSRLLMGQFYYLFLIPLSFIPVLLLKGTDFFYLREYFLIPFLMLLAGYFTVMSIKQVYGEQKIGDQVLWLVVYAAVFQCIVALLMFFVPTVKDLVFALIRYDALAQERVAGIAQFRIIGFGTQFFGAGVINSIAIVVLAHFMTLKTDRSKYMKWRDLAFLGLLIVVGMALSRTSVVGIILGFSLIFYQEMIYRGHAVKTLKILSVVVVTGLILFFFMNKIIAFISEDINDPIFAFGFELFINLIEEGELGSSSSDTMISMYQILPEKVSTWLIGDGMFRDSNRLAYYMNVDIGYLRIIFATGLLGLAAYLLSHFLVLKILINIPPYGLLGYLLFFILLAILLKGIMILYPIFCVIAYSCSLQHQAHESN